jgi:hypothetical protein
MSSREYVRWGGMALLAGGVLAAIGFAVQSFAGPTSSLWIPTTVLALFGLVLILLGFPVLYAVLARATGGLGLVGYVLLFVSGLVAGIGATVLSLIVPYLAQNIPGFMTTAGLPPVMGNYFAVAGIIRLIAGVVFGAAIVRAGTPERVAGMLLILAAIIGFAGGIFNSVPHLGDLGRVLLVLALGWMGWTLMTRHVAEMEPYRAPAEGTTGAHARA